MQLTHHLVSNNMADRDIKLNKAREKLDKFRKKKKMQDEPEKQSNSSVPSSSNSSPIMFTVKTDTMQNGENEGIEKFYVE